MPKDNDVARYIYSKAEDVHKNMFPTHITALLLLTYTNLPIFSSEPTMLIEVEGS